MTRFDLAALLSVALLIVVVGAGTRFAASGFTWSSVGQVLFGLIIVSVFVFGRVRGFWENRYGNAEKRYFQYRYRAYDTIEIDGSGIQMRSLVKADIPLPWSGIAASMKEPASSSSSRAALTKSF